MFNLNSNFQCWDLKQSTGGSQYVSRNLNALLTFKIHPCEWICWPHWVVGTQDKKAYRWSFVCVVDQDQANRARNADHAARTFQSFVYFIVTITRLYDYQALQTHLIFEKFLRCAKVCGLFFSWLSFLGADWLGRQTPITWIVYLPSVRVCREIFFFHVIHHFWGTNVIPAFLERSEYVQF